MIRDRQKEKASVLSSLPSKTLRTLPVKIAIPVALTIALFILTIYLVMIPLLEENMMDTKREGIRHLTESAWSALQLFHNKAQDGALSKEQAQTQAISHFQKLRYGPDQVDYFWINDMVPRMIMHPYRPDLVGTNVSGFKDPLGKQMFVEMVRTVNENGAGFVDYWWQWQDNPEKIVPKISYVKAFAPWGWVIGTGIYVNDIKEEIRAVTKQVTLACSGILFLFIMLSGYIVWQGANARKVQIAAMEHARLKEKQLVQADKMASLGILVAGVAHEVNNPVTSIMLNAPSLKKAWHAFSPVLDDHYKCRPDERVCNLPYTELNKRFAMMLTGIEDSAARIKQIITELKDFARPGDNDRDQQVDCNVMITKSLDLTRSLIKKSTHNLSVDLDEELPPIFANSQKLQQVIINLIVNACQALENPDQAISVSTRFLQKSNEVLIMVADTGPGITGAALEKIKDPFFTTKRDDGGTGLGLSISEKIISEHKGQLLFSSGLGKGLTAKIVLPVHTDGPQQIQKPSHLKDT
jgi:signal transduction histidine kinase